MPEYPLLDLRDRWNEARGAVGALAVLSAELLSQSEGAWRTDMRHVVQQAEAALDALRALPPGLLEGIARDQCSLMRELNEGPALPEVPLYHEAD